MIEELWNEDMAMAMALDIEDNSGVAGQE